ncbi:putative exocyst complex component Sec5 [Aulographum hederae CBS 113979]|uniref:Exocyst complex component SEC5 n=1 Tax=Aulographum hederae CBS 113979 TaxID=1176131 RepID=A0A6G1HGU8_9PEZI|nr:putative exocyst complex component Sec5 [Aulographum hederae CBS 113979]
MSESTLLNHYKISSLNPIEWPAEKDQDSSDDEQLPQTATANPIRRSKSRYSVLEPRRLRKSGIAGAEKTKDGIDNLVQKDEPDPLGDHASVVQALRQRGLPVEDDLKLRNRFLLSSTTFNPNLFLAQVHRDASTDTLFKGLDYLSRSIEQKSASLKVLVESNFERFVRAKATIDNVYTEMRNKGHEPESPTSPRRPHSRQQSRQHSRQTSRSSLGHYRQSSNPMSPRMDAGRQPESPSLKKNALLKENEYGVQPIKSPLMEVAIKAEEVWGPALGGKDKEESLKAVLACVEKNRGMFELGLSLRDCIKRKDHENLVEDYTRARKYANDAKSIADKAIQNRVALTDSEIHTIIVTGRMWADVEEQIEAFKRDVWRRLAGTHFTKQPVTEPEKSEEHMSLISILLELGVEDNPIWVWLLSRYDFLKNKITATAERSRVETEVLRRRLASSEKPSLAARRTHLLSATNQGRPADNSTLDSTKVMEFWDHVHTSLRALLATQGGVLGEVIEFWETAQSFIDGKAQKTLPIGIDRQSQKHHRLSGDGVKDLQSGALELVNLIRESVFAFFADPPPEDISMLYSPIPPDTPLTPVPRTPKSAGLSPRSTTRFQFDLSDIPPPSPRTGQSWEKYAFWPPTCNALSGVHFLSKIMILVGTAASDMAGLNIARDTSRQNDTLKALLGGVRERCAQAVCSAWGNDAETFKVLEDWTRSTERREYTNYPQRFGAIEGTLLGSMQKILYVSEAMNRPGSAAVVVPPSAKLIQMVRSQFVGSIYKSLSGMVENAERPLKLGNMVVDDDDDLAKPARNLIAPDSDSTIIDASNRARQNVRILLTLSNLHNLQSSIIPSLTSTFESLFSVTFTEENATIRDVLAQIEARLFQSYVEPLARSIDRLVQDGISSPTWEPQTPRPTDARPYIYEVLLELVAVHAEASAISTSLTTGIIKKLLEEASKSLINAFQKRAKYTLAALMQATLDVEFLAQTLNNYTSEKTSEVQSKIYVKLDERTDNEARLRLQGELPELRGVLKRLRVKTGGEFGCFRRARGATVGQGQGHGSSVASGNSGRSSSRAM